MSNLSKRSTIFFDPTIHQALKIRAASSSQSVSELVDEAIRLLLEEDRADLEAYVKRKMEPEITYKKLLKELKKTKSSN